MKGLIDRRLRTIFAMAVSVASVAAAPLPGFAQERVRGNEQWRYEISIPGPDHERLDAMVGEWTTQVQTWRGPYDRAPYRTTGWASRQWALDGRFLELKTGTTGPDGEIATIGYGYLGFNRLTGLYQNAWMTNYTTGMFLETGRYDPVSNAIHLEGYDTDPWSGCIILSRTVIQIESPDRHTLTAFSRACDGREYKELEIIYERKQED